MTSPMMITTMLLGCVMVMVGSNPIEKQVDAIDNLNVHTWEEAKTKEKRSKSDQNTKTQNAGQYLNIHYSIYLKL